MRILVDMNLTPEWCGVFERRGWAAVHWSQIGDPGATDREIMEWASTNGYAVFTHDLDFGAVLAATRARGPSVVQVRAQNLLPSHLEDLVVRVFQQHHAPIETGALVVVEELRARVRILPLGDKPQTS